MGRRQRHRALRPRPTRHRAHLASRCQPPNHGLMRSASHLAVVLNVERERGIGYERPLMPRRAALALLSFAGSIEATAHAAEPSPFSDALRLVEDRGWAAGTIQEQLDRDPTLVPFGKGAVFVPAMTDPLDEPPVA